MTRIDLQQFCCEANGIRPYLERPFRLGDFTYATNRWVLVRVPAVDGDPAADFSEASGLIREALNSESIDKILAAQPDATFAPLRVTLPARERKPCSYCGGSGAVTSDATGAMICDDCDGAGSFEVETSVSIAGVLFQAKYIAQIAALPEAEFPTNPAAGRDVVPCPFRFRGGVGALMPMARKGAAHLGDLDQFRVTP